MRKIKEVRLELDKLREDYESKVALLKAEITSIRESRGYKLKEKSYEPYYEAGRSTMPTPSGGMGSVPYMEAGSMCDGLGKSFF